MPLTQVTGPLIKSLTPIDAEVSESVATSTGSNTSRLLADRFASDLNVKDFGAVGDGIADDTLPIYRALVAATLWPQNNNVDINTIQLNTTSPNAPGQGGLSFPIGYVQQGRRTVILPTGVYRITSALPVGHGTQLVGDDATDKPIIKPDYTAGAFNAIECVSAYKNRVLPYQGSNAVNPPAENNMYNAFMRLENFSILPGDSSGFYTTIQRRNDVTWYAISIMTGGWLYANGSTGSSTVTYTGNSGYLTPLPAGTMIKFLNHATTYTVTNSSSNTWTLNQPLTDNLTSTGVLLGITGTNGIFLAGGQEASTIKRLLIQKMSGAGIHIYWGSPAPTIENCMVNACPVAYWMDSGPATLTQPSGDQNEILFRIAWYVGHGSTYNLIGTKEETFAQANIAAGLGYKKTTIQASSVGPIPTSISVIGGALNAPADAPVADYQDRGLTEIHRDGAPAVVNMLGCQNVHAWGDYLIKYFNRSTGAYEDLFSLRRSGGFQECRTFHNPNAGMYLAHGSGLSNIAAPTYGITNLTLQARPNTNSVGIQMDNNGGVYLRSVPWTRTTTTLTFTLAGHTVKKNDWLRISGLTGVTPTGFHPSGTGAVKCTGASGSTFTIAVLDSGSTSGTVTQILVLSIVAFHVLEQGTHLFQSPTNTGGNNKIAEWVDWDGNSLSGIRAPAGNVAQVWSKDGFTMGGTMALPAVDMYFGTGGNPSDTNRPDGSLFMRKDGAPDSVLWVKSNNAYYPLLSRNTFLSGTAAPTTTPEFIGQHFINTTTAKVYVATGTASAANWTIVN